MSSSAAPLRARLVRGLVCVIVALTVAFLPRPEAVPDPAGWRCLAIFAGVIAGLILQPLPMGPVVLLGLLVAVLTRSLPMPADLAAGREFKEGMRAATSGFGEPVVWLVVGAFLIASAVRDTGLGRRIALELVRRLGRRTLGLGYAQMGAELLLGPIVPSNTARGGGILAPISRSLAEALDSRPGPTADRAGAYLTFVGAHANLITAAMFLTGMAANPVLAAQAADAFGGDFEFGWVTWALGALVPGLAAAALLPLFLYWIAKPTVTDGRPAQELARAELAKAGAWTRGERTMGAVFVGLLLLWATSAWTHLDTALVAWVGVAVLIVSGVRTWDDISKDWRSWDALIWLGGLLTLANALRDFQVVAWFADTVGGAVSGFSPLWIALALGLAYFFSMYGFSMLTAHITSMGAAFLAVAAGAGVPALLIVPLLAYFSNLCACTTNYSTGPVILYFGQGYVSTPRWFRVGFLVALFQLGLWIPLGLAWWKLLGWW